MESFQTTYSIGHGLLAYAFRLRETYIIVLPARCPASHCDRPSQIGTLNEPIF